MRRFVSKTLKRCQLYQVSAHGEVYRSRSFSTVTVEEVEYDHRQIADQSRAIEAELTELRQCYSEVKVHVAESLHPASAIVDYATSHKSWLIVVGDKGKTAIQRILIGSVARHILHRAPCAVLVVKLPKS